MASKVNKKVDLSGEKNIPTHVVAVFGIIRKGSKYLISRRSYSDPQAGGQWSVPSGKVEIEEGIGIIEKTLKREILEEVGLKIKDKVVLLGNGAFTRVSGHNVIGLTFLCDWKSGIAKPLEDQEEIRWLHLPEILNFKEIPNYTMDKFKLLDKYLKKIN